MGVFAHTHNRLGPLYAEHRGLRFFFDDNADIRNSRPIFTTDLDAARSGLGIHLLSNSALLADININAGFPAIYFVLPHPHQGRPQREQQHHRSDAEPQKLDGHFAPCFGNQRSHEATQAKGPCKE